MTNVGKTTSDEVQTQGNGTSQEEAGTNGGGGGEGEEEKWSTQEEDQDDYLMSEDVKDPVSSQALQVSIRTGGGEGEGEKEKWSTQEEDQDNVKGTCLPSFPRSDQNYHYLRSPPCQCCRVRYRPVDQML